MKVLFISEKKKIGEKVFDVLSNLNRERFSIVEQITEYYANPLSRDSVGVVSFHYWGVEPSPMSTTVAMWKVKLKEHR